jgi:hypothetical protein
LISSKSKNNNYAAVGSVIFGNWRPFLKVCSYWCLSRRVQWTTWVRPSLTSPSPGGRRVARRNDKAVSFVNWLRILYFAAKFSLCDISHVAVIATRPPQLDFGVASQFRERALLRQVQLAVRTWPGPRPDTTLTSYMVSLCNISKLSKLKCR